MSKNILLIVGVVALIPSVSFGVFSFLNRRSRKGKALFFSTNTETDSEKMTTQGKLPTPYKVFDGNMLILTGSMDANVAKNWLDNEPDVDIRLKAQIGKEPIQQVEEQDDSNQPRRVPCSLILANFLDSNIGPHTEVQFSVSVKARNNSVLGELPQSCLSHAFSLQDGALCASLFNNTDKCVAYNKELLGHCALKSNEKCDLVYTLEDEGFSFEIGVADENGKPLIIGKIANPGRPDADLPDVKEVFQYYGILETLKMIFFWSCSLVVNRSSDFVTKNLGGKAWTMGLGYCALPDKNDFIDLLDTRVAPKGHDFQIDTVTYYPDLYFLYNWQDQKIK